MRLPVETYGSGLGGDASTGRLDTVWYQPTRAFDLFVAGYPNAIGNRLDAELEFPDGTRRIIPLQVPNSGEDWQLRRCNIESIGGAARMRIVATDGSSAFRGWLAISEPVRVTSGGVVGVESLLRIVLTILASVTFLVGPGLAWKGLTATLGGRSSFVWVPIPGAVLLTLWGFLAWCLRLRGIPDLLYPIAFSLLAVLVFAYVRYGGHEAVSLTEQKVLRLFLLVIAIACGKGLYSYGPAGELYLNTVSRSNEVGDRSDSRVPFHITQLVANGMALNSPDSRILFAPYFPTSRGPIAGLAASPVVLLTGAAVPKVEMDQPWAPFDVQGFAGYRVLMVCLAASSLLTFFGLAEGLTTSAKLALAGTALLAMSPFFVHEVYFTWPKLFASLFVLVSFHCALQDRYLLSGLVLGVAYLVHPLALLSLPVLFLLFAARLGAHRLFSRQYWRTTPRTPTARLLEQVLWRAACASAVCVAIFEGWNLLSDGSSQGSQFFPYLISANGILCRSLGGWVADRAVSVLNTLVPGYLFVRYGNDPRINSVWGPSPAIIRFYFSYWNTLPFGVGIVLFFPLMGWMWSLARKYTVPFVLFVAGPFALFATYWGSSHSGLMREGLHPWFLSIFLFLTWAISKAPELAARVAKPGAAIQPFRAVELLGMLLVTTLMSQPGVISGRYAVTDVAALIAMAGGSIFLALTARNACVDCIPSIPSRAATSRKKAKKRRVT